jgi:hypothetical protein
MLSTNDAATLQALLVKKAEAHKKQEEEECREKDVNEFSKFIWKLVTSSPNLFGNLLRVLQIYLETCYEFSKFIWKLVTSSPNLFGNLL